VAGPTVAARSGVDGGSGAPRCGVVRNAGGEAYGLAALALYGEPPKYDDEDEDS